ncbi:MAG: XdhC family protein [Chloroflexi bacterium]|nr:XdhC family protein [Chloroflexota bacterium]
MRDILETVQGWIADSRRIALATVTETWGSAPRGVGAKMAVTGETAIIGSVSGGCVETAVIGECLATLKDGKVRLLQYGVSDDNACEVGLTCAGRMGVLVEPLDLTWWQTVVARTGQEKPAITLTVLSGEHAGAKALSDGATLLYTNGLPEMAHEAFADAGAAALQSGRSEIAGMEVLIDVQRPRPHLIVIGGVHIAMPLAQFAQIVGFRVSIVDPREVFATPERFPGASAISHRYPDRALPDLGIDADTYVAVLTHDPKIDDKALITALPSPARYIGVLSSRKTHEKRLVRLREAGLSEELLARIHTPIGLDIGARTPEEIAVGIMAEILAVRNGKMR